MKLQLSAFRIWMIILCMVVVDDSHISEGKPQPIKPGCRYEGRRYQEGTMVTTSEPCLRCHCIEGALRCRLRVCPRLPNSPPSGCRIRAPADNVCCAELVCDESSEVETSARKANVELKQNSHKLRSEGCIYEGVKYGPGSAMMGSRRCEYCYCISGARRCIRPKCLLKLPGCTPLYAPDSCCPVSYNCTHLRQPSTMAPVSGNVISSGCRLANRTYEEGEMVRDVTWKASCDNCFCAMGAIRCVPLACAPPLHGCSPIVRDGQCCPSTYNCSGNIEVKAAQNYASFAFISKDYAKFRKETNFFPAIDHHATTPIEGRGHRVVEEQKLDASTINFKEEPSLVIDTTSTVSTFETEIMNNEILMEGTDYTRSTSEIAATTTVISTEETTIIDTQSVAWDYSTASLNDSIPTDSPIMDSTLIMEEVSSSATTLMNDVTSSIEDSTTSSSLDPTTVDLESVLDNLCEDRCLDGIDKLDGKSSGLSKSSNSTSMNLTILEKHEKEIIQNSSLKKNTTMDSEVVVKGSTAGTNSSSTVLMPDNILVMNVTVKTNVSVGHIQGVTINPIRSIPPDIEAILNITHREKADEYDYDYSEPTLPPSLPNVRIIPFVAADALVKNKDVPSTVTRYPSGSGVVPPEFVPTEKSSFYDMATQKNRFIPPIETEGGFVPKEPPPYFDTPYHSTDLNLEIGTGVTVASAILNNPHRKNDDLSSNCIFKNQEYHHGDILPKQGMCVICTCYYGEIVCSPEKCPPLKIGCKMTNSQAGCCGKIVCVETDEFPTVVLDRAEPPIVDRQSIVSPDPFRDVIKTEPAPDLPSLIEDMLPYLVEHGITTSRSTTPMTTPVSVPSSQGKDTIMRSPNYDYLKNKLPIMRPLFEYPKEIDKNTPSIFPNNNYGFSKLQTSSMHRTKNPLQNQILMHAMEESEQSAELSDELKPPLTSEQASMFYSDQKTQIPTTMMPRNETIDHTSTTTIHQNASRIINSSKSTMNKTRYAMNDDLPSTTIKNILDQKVEHEKDEDSAEEDSIFSLDSVFDLLFSGQKTSTISSTFGTTTPTTPTATASSSSTTTTTTTPTTPAAAASTLFTTTNSTPATSTSSTTTSVKTSTHTKNSATTPPKAFENEISSPTGALKLAGCNIYGRMYRVGRIITELSSSCLECRCTEIGVQCKQLEC